MTSRQLLRQIEKSKEQLLGLLTTWHDLQTKTLPKILYQYENLFGNIESEIAQKESVAKASELKYQLLLCSANSDKKSAKSVELVEQLIKQAEARYNERNQQILKLQRIFSIANNPNILLDTTLNDEFDLSNIYRQIVKKLHPDIVGHNAKLRNCWDSVQYCYNNKDIKHLQMYYFVLCENYDNSELEEQHLIDRAQIIEEYLKQQATENKELIIKEPFCFENKFEDQKWIIEKKNDLRNKLMQINKRIMHNERLLKQIV